MIPNAGVKTDAEAVFSPRDAVATHGDGGSEAPQGVILGFQPTLTDVVTDRSDRETQLVRSQSIHHLTETVGYVPVHRLGIGAPVAATVTENLIAAGTEAIVLLAGCGCLQPEYPAETAILPTEAIRDEGVSYHYVAGEESLEPTEPLVDRLEAELSAAEFPTPRGRTWTTSALYRETVPEVSHYREAGVASVGMESAAIWAVCAYRGVATATVHQIGDYVTATEWVPDSGGDRGLPAMLDPVLDGLQAFLGDR